ncbi:MAG: hypothetical protein R3175_15270 [Marinobacter sp.]|uniref:hypothetical protein n=1 Tax=Marinobacter sp. TaxID=50741 RepID=UPI00299D60EF|nr:hypothetical protein [Marinobacter sp.]MDX1757416.1 hypothetical protein [Marinobacter sp.]
MKTLCPTLALILSSLLLSACASPKTPQDVSAAFWQAIIENDAGDSTELSTLVDEAAYDGYQRDWAGVTLSWGRVVIDGNEATVETTIEGLAEEHGEPLETTTYLVKLDDQWLVDYHRTGDALSGNRLFNQMVGELERFSRQLQARFHEQSSEAAIELERLARDLEKQMSLAGDRLSILVEEYGKQLEASLEALSESIKEALKAHPSASPDDKRTLNQAVIRLDQRRDALDEPTLHSVAEGSYTLAETQFRLNTLGEEFAGYQSVWRAEIENTQRELSQLMSEI